MSALDPIQELYRNSKAIADAEVARCEAQNRWSHELTERARAERDPELVAVDVSNKFQADLARMDSRDAQRVLEETGGQHPAVRAVKEGEHEQWTADEVQQLVDELDPADRKRLKL